MTEGLRCRETLEGKWSTGAGPGLVVACLIMGLNATFAAFLALSLLRSVSSYMVFVLLLFVAIVSSFGLSFNRVLCVLWDGMIHDNTKHYQSSEFCLMSSIHFYSSDYE